MYIIYNVTKNMNNFEKRSSFIREFYLQESIFLFLITKFNWRKKKNKNYEILKL